MESTKKIKQGAIEDYISTSAVTALATKLTHGSYTGSAKDLETLINSAVTGASGKSIVPTDTPTGTGIKSWIATQNGTYTNFGGVVVNTNSFAVISRDAAGVFSISQTGLDLTTYLKIVDGNKNYSPILTEVQKNKFNINAIDNEAGFYMDGNGYKGANAGYYLSGFIPVKASTWYYPSVNDRVVFFDINKTYISGLGGGRATQQFQTPANALFVRITRAQNPPINLQLEDGQVGTTYEAYKELIPKSKLAPFILVTNEIANKAINVDKVTFLKTGKNLYNLNDSDVAKGVYFTSNQGTIGSLAGASVTGFIPIIPSTVYFCNKSYNGGALNIIYDANKLPISSFNTSSFTAPANSAYVRYSLNVTDTALSTAQVEVGSVGTSYESYYLILSPLTGAPIKATELTLEGVTKVFIAMPDKAIKRQATDFFETGKNKFDKNASDITLGAYIFSGSGSALGNASYNSTGFIPVTAGLPYSFGPTDIGNQNAWFDSNKTYISGFTGSVSTNVIAPTNASFVRLSVVATNWNAFQVEQNSVKTAYTPYSLVLKSDTIDLSSSTAVKDAFPMLLKNNISIPAKIHFLKGFENSIYYQAIVKRFIPNLFYTRINGGTILNFDKLARTTPANTAGYTLNSLLYDGDFSVIKAITTTAVIGDPATNTSPVSLLAIGDSFTDSGVYLSRLKTLLPNFSLHGTNKRTNVGGTTNTVNSEGRSGWSLGQYLNTMWNASWAGFSPFLQPVSPYNYYGNTRTWKDFLAGTAGQGFYDKGVEMNFSPSTGYRQTPNVNDVMYVDANNRYEVWNGSVWAEITSATLGFTFNFAKYRAVWSIAKPTFVSVMLGMNDFRFSSPAQVIIDFTAWKTQLDTMIASVFTDGVTKFAICLPLSSVGLMDNQGGNFVAMQNACLWEQRRLIIENYDNREGEGIYIVDTGSSTDPVYGFDVVAESPFSEYSGIKTIDKTFNQPHPSISGYNQMGTRLAAFIQALR